MRVAISITLTTVLTVSGLVASLLSVRKRARAQILRPMAAAGRACLHAIVGAALIVLFVAFGLDAAWRLLSGHAYFQLEGIDQGATLAWAVLIGLVWVAVGPLLAWLVVRCR